MAKEASVAPKERVNITYKPATGDATEEVELPLKILSIGDYTGKPDDRPLEERKPINIDKDNFNSVMRDHELSTDIAVKNELTGNEGDMLPVHLEFNTLKDFEPQAIVDQVPELQQLLELRKALTVLKGPLGNIPAFRKKLQALVTDDEKRSQLTQELRLNADNSAANAEDANPSETAPSENNSEAYSDSETPPASE